MSNIQWTETPPTKPGYYWWRDPESGWEEEQPVEVFELGPGNLLMQQFGCAADRLTGEWGPEIVLQDETKGGDSGDAL